MKSMILMILSPYLKKTIKVVITCDLWIKHVLYIFTMKIVLSLQMRFPVTMLNRAKRTINRYLKQKNKSFRMQKGRVPTHKFENKSKAKFVSGPFYVLDIEEIVSANLKKLSFRVYQFVNQGNTVFKKHKIYSFFQVFPFLQY